MTNNSLVCLSYISSGLASILSSIIDVIALQTCLRVNTCILIHIVRIVRLTYLMNHGTADNLVIITCQLCYLVGVMTKVQRSSPKEVLLLNVGRRNGHLNTLVTHRTYILSHGSQQRRIIIVTWDHRDRTVHNQIGCITYVVIQCYRDTVEECQVKTKVPSLVLLPLQVLVSYTNDTHTIATIVVLTILIKVHVTIQARWKSSVHTIRYTNLTIAQYILDRIHELFCTKAPSTRYRPERTPTILTCHTRTTITTIAYTSIIQIVIVVVDTTQERSHL